MRCPNCNVELKAQAKFCPKCGTKIPEGQGAVSDAEGVVSEVKPEPSADRSPVMYRITGFPIPDRRMGRARPGRPKRRAAAGSWPAGWRFWPQPAWG